MRREGYVLSAPLARNFSLFYAEITPEIVVYRYSPVRVLEYLRVKVVRLSAQEVFEGSRTLIRGLAKDGLMEDGKEDLLEGTG